MAKRSKQLYLSHSYAPRLEHGGPIRKGKRKLARPIDPKRPMHLVMRAEVARNRLSLLRHVRAIDELARRLAKRNRLQIYSSVNVGNHIHMIVRAKSRRGLQNFLRVFAGHVAQLVTGALKGQAFGKFWDALAYTRIAEWGRAFRILRHYLTINTWEAAGIFGARNRSTVKSLNTTNHPRIG